MYQILMPIDKNEDRVAAQTETVLEFVNAADDVSVTLLHVFADDDDRAENTSPSQLTPGRDAKNRLADAGATIREESRTGSPAETILETAYEIGANQIVLGGRKRSPLGALVFGSVSQDVLRKAGRPVTVTGSVDTLERPSHRCANCGETYYADPSTEIRECRRCGGVHVETLTDEPTESTA
ncbi:universal stress protein [Halobacteria archaeon AArc-m2/3/4]|uniref:Universal stress protein n=1 Tax=Natronoglomus mannanivorans TaxID=2979990 RepID=A0AAP2Z3T7_9EURY|nr:universal stress protein [Halobacteria archaeon AArc-xg1-1]MCU4974669.1 universal stress protein [Halobacteria archaeon AArc-m2/3/4]